MRAMDKPTEHRHQQINNNNANSEEPSWEEKRDLRPKQQHINNNHFSDNDDDEDDDDDDPYDISSMSEEEARVNNDNKNNSSNHHDLIPSSPNRSKLPPAPTQDNNTNNKHNHPPQSQSNNAKSSIASSPSSNRHLIPPPSPAGSVASMTSNTSPTNSKSQALPLSMPRFYDSEDEGHGSLVFVGDNSVVGIQPSSSETGTTSQQQQQQQGQQLRLSKILNADGSDNIAGAVKPTKVLSSSNHVDEDPPQLMPYHQRVKLLSMKEPPPPSDVLASPPPPLPSTTNSTDPNMSPLQAGDKKSSNQKIRPPFHPNPSRGGAGGALADKYKLATIPAFRGAEGGNDQKQMTVDGNSEYDKAKLEGKQRILSSTSPLSSPEKAMENPRDRPPLSRSNSPKQTRSPSTQDVICPPQSQAAPPPSPRSGGFHVRIQSQGSISSIGSHAGVDSDDYGEQFNQPLPALPYQVNMQQQPVHPHNMPPPNYYYGYPQQHPPQSMPMNNGGYPQQHLPPPPITNGGYPQHHPPPPPINNNGGYRQQHPPPPSNVPNAPTLNFNDVLGPDIATFLHGEKIANATTQPPQWKPSHGAGNAGWGGAGGSPYNLNQKYYPHARPEPPPPPLTVVPNMTLHRARLPSISDDDWAEEMEKINKMEDGEDIGNVKNTSERKQRHNQRHHAPPPPPPPPPPHYHHPPPAAAVYYNNQNPMAHDYYGQQPNYPRMDLSHGQEHGMNAMYNRNNDPQDRNAEARRQDHDAQHYYQYSQRGNHESDFVVDGNRGAHENPPHERSSLLSPSGVQTYESRNENHHNNLYSREDYHNHNYYPGVNDNRSKEDAEKKYLEHRRRKKKKSKRRKEKERRRLAQSSDSSQEDESKRSYGTPNKSRGRRNNRKGKRDAAAPDGNSEDLSESVVSRSAEHRTRSKNANGNALLSIKLLLCNLPLSAASISFSIVLLGIVWLKWTEENLSTCKEVNFHSSQCTLPDFPGCYFCDEMNRVYQIATRFHLVSSYVAGISVMGFIAKAVLCWNAFVDEMSSPTTASPAGLIFMTMAMSFVGKGDVGEIIVLLASFFHLILVVWFIYMSLAYQTMPDPSWFPNTIGIGLCAVKVWFYYPLAGHFIVLITLMLTFLYFPISLIRVALNEKMSATICWMQMMCPAIPLYALSIIMQPSFFSEAPDISHFQTLQRTVYLPSMTVLFALCVMGMMSSVVGVIMRWEQISSEEFSPAHAAYSFPLLMHAIAVQSYRSSLDFFGGNEVSATLKSALHIYWVFLVTFGTFVALMCIMMYLAFLPTWAVHINTENEEEPPAINETSMSDYVADGEALIQHYVSPAILQANETGVLVMTHGAKTDKCFLIRTRQVPALGFEPMMTTRNFARERKRFIECIGQNEAHEGDEDGNDQETENGDLLGRSDRV